MRSDIEYRGLCHSDREQMKKARQSLDLILSTIPVDHDMTPYLRLLKRDGTYLVLGVMAPLTSAIPGGLLAGQQISISGSTIGGLAQTQEVLDFCAEHGICADIAIIPMAGINDAYDQLHAGDPKHRFVIDLSTLT